MKTARIFIIFSLIFFSVEAFSQISLSGKITNKKGNIISYVNIGIRNKNLGTISDEKGRFNLNIPDSLSAYKLTFSCVGFEEFSIPISSLKNKNSLNVSLNTKTFKLAEVKISNKKPRIKKLGITGYMPKVSGNISWYKNNDIAEHGRVIKIDKPSRLLTANAVVWVNEKPRDSITFRLNIYAVDEDLPGKRLVEKSIIKTFPLKNPVLTFDLREENIILKDDFVMAFEYIPDAYHRKNKLNSPTNFRANIGIMSAFVRMHSLGTWQKLKAGSATMYVEVEQ